MAHELPTLLDDGLITEEIGDWGTDKYQLLRLYVQLFSASMRTKWDCRVYIDLFAGSGRARIKGTTRIVAASPLIALDIEPPFDQYIFCEKNKEKIDALQTRVCQDHPEAKAVFQPGDANELVGEVLEKSHSTHEASKC
jgi:three-Cys-motif partner protein